MPMVSRIGRRTEYAENMKNTQVAASSTPASSVGRALIAAASQRAEPDCPGVSTVPSGSTADIGGTPEIETQNMAGPGDLTGRSEELELHGTLPLYPAHHAAGWKGASSSGRKKGSVPYAMRWPACSPSAPSSRSRNSLAQAFTTRAS